MTESVYVHIDTTSNAVLTKGLTATDFANSIVHFLLKTCSCLIHLLLLENMNPIQG